MKIDNPPKQSSTSKTSQLTDGQILAFARALDRKNLIAQAYSCLESLEKSSPDAFEELIQQTTNGILDRGDMDIARRSHTFEEFPYYNKKLGIEPGSMVELIAKGGTGKSWVATYLGLCLATGRQLFEYSYSNPEEAIKVLYLDQENIVNDLTKAHYRISRIVTPWYDEDDANNTTLTQELLSNNFIVAKSNEPLSPSNFDSLIAHLKSYVKENGIKVLIIDSLKFFTSGYSENSNDDMNKVLTSVKNALIIPENELCIVWIHHLGKDGNIDGRGAGGIGDAMDVKWVLKQENKEKESTIYSIFPTKERNIRINSISFRMYDAGRITVAGAREYMLFAELDSSTNIKTEIEISNLLKACHELSLINKVELKEYEFTKSELLLKNNNSKAQREAFDRLILLNYISPTEATLLKQRNKKYTLTKKGLDYYVETFGEEF
jgi:hypothetical protein